MGHPKSTKSDRQSKPVSQPLDISCIPAELTSRKQWVTWSWRWKEQDQKWDKPPDGKTNDPSTWLTFDEAFSQYEAGRVTGIGFVFSADDDLAGVDLDDCRDPETGELSEFAQKVLDRCPSYAEVSPSQTGVKLFVRGTWCNAAGEVLPGYNGDVRGNRVEVYDRLHYFTLTGAVLDGHTDIVDGQPLLDRIETKRTKKQAKQTTTSTNGQAHVKTDDRQRRMKRCQKYLETTPNAVSGQRGHDTTLRAACECFRFGLDDDDAIIVMDWYNATKCKPPWTDRELAHKLDSAREKVEAAGDFGCRVNNTTDTLSPQHWTATSSDDVKEAPRAPRPSVSPESMTEVANALRIIDDHGHNIRWCGPWRKWLIWDGRRWKMDQSCYVQRLAMRTLDNLFLAIPDIAKTCTRQELNKFITFAKASNSANGVEHALELARAELPILPDQLNKDPWLFNVLNGTIDLRTNGFREHRREDFLTAIADVNYDVDASAPTFHCFLREIFVNPDGSPDEELIHYVKKCVGMSLTGIVKDHVLLFCYGHGANGKSTLMGAIKDMLGADYFLSANQELITVTRDQHPTIYVDLFEKRFVLCSEIDDGKRLAEAIVKRMTGGDNIRARRCGEDFWEFQPTHKTWLMANHKPVIRGRDHAMWRRVKLIPFLATITKDRMDQELPEKLRAELPGILLWALSGCEDWRADGLQDIQVVTDATAEYRDEMDLVKDFLSECCELGDGFQIGATDLWQAYTSYCKRCNEEPIWRNTFANALQREGITREKNKTVTYLGVRLRWYEPRDGREFA